jgi:hypothetical protein
MFPDDDIRETIINYADGAGEENTVIKLISLFMNLFSFQISYLLRYYKALLYISSLSFGFS